MNECLQLGAALDESLSRLESDSAELLKMLLVQSCLSFS